MNIGDIVTPLEVIPRLYIDQYAGFRSAEINYVGSYINRPGKVIGFMAGDAIVEFPPPCPFCISNKDHVTTMRFRPCELRTDIAGEGVAIK